MTTTTDSENYFWIILQINHKCMLAMLCGTKCYMWCADALSLQFETANTHHIKVEPEIANWKIQEVDKRGFLGTYPTHAWFFVISLPNTELALLIFFLCTFRHLHHRYIFSFGTMNKVTIRDLDLIRFDTKVFWIWIEGK